MRKYIILFVAALFLSLPISQAANAAANVNWVDSGTVVVGDNLATFTIPDQLMYLNKEDTLKLQKEIGDTPTELEIGSIFPQSEDESWLVVVEYEEVGYITDEEKNDIDADAILDSYKEGTEENNKGRAPEDQLHVVGWDVPPFYDQPTHTLHWSMIGEDNSKNQLINYKAQMLTREGYVSFTLVTDPANLAKDKQVLMEKIIPNFSMKEGKRYEDFNESTDKVAEYGLTGLVLGGLGLAIAKKAGLLALLALVFKKGWVVIVVAIGALFKWLTGRNKKNKQQAQQQEENQNPQDPTPPASVG